MPAWPPRARRIALARTTPRRLGYPFELWPRARLPRAIPERVRRQVARGTIRTWRQAEGLAWKRQHRWFPVAGEAAFVENRGAIIQAYTQPVPERRVIGLEALGPGSANTSPGGEPRPGVPAEGRADRPQSRAEPVGFAGIGGDQVR
jgi:hypothetical protein